MNPKETEPRETTARKSRAAQMAELKQALADLERSVDELSRQNGSGPSEAATLPSDSAWSSSSEPTWDAPPALAPSAIVVLPTPGGGWDGQQPGLDSETLRLLTRFLSGAAMWGADELLERLRFWQAQVDAGSIQVPAPKPLADATPTDLTRYFVLGTLAWGRRKLVAVANDAFRATGALASTADRLTDNWLLRPLRDPVDAALVSLALGVRERIQEGWQEEQISRWLATQTIPDITHDTTDYLIDYVSDNPQLAALVRDQLGQQSLGMATTVRDNSRQLSGGADALVEGLVRKLLRRKPRRELPGSPLAGKPQTMYSLGTELSAGGDSETD